MSIAIIILGSIASLATALFAIFMAVFLYSKQGAYYARRSSRRGALFFYAHGILIMVAAIFLDEKFLLIAGGILTALAIPLIIFTMKREWIMTMSLIVFMALILVAGILLVTTSASYNETAGIVAASLTFVLLGGGIAFEVWQAHLAPKVFAQLLMRKYLSLLMMLGCLNSSLWAIFWGFYLDRSTAATTYIELAVALLSAVATGALLIVRKFHQPNVGPGPGTVTMALRQRGTMTIQPGNAPSAKAADQ